MITVGIDAGSRTIKAVVLDAEKKQILASGIVDQGIRQHDLARDLVESLLAKSSLAKSDIHKTVATGYGRNLLTFADRAITEISCQAAGVLFRCPQARSIIDIGGQDSKFILLDANQNVANFAMNDRCAAGTGRFLEVVATRLNTDIFNLGNLALSAQKSASISSMCVVFAETEIISLLAENVSPAEIAAGVISAIASRVVAMTGGKVADPVVFTGGVALIQAMQNAIEKQISHEVIVIDQPQVSAALGAAVLAAR